MSGSQFAMPRHGMHACRNRYHDVVLVVVYDKRFGDWLVVHERLKKAYTPLFRQIVYTGFMLQVRRCSMRETYEGWCCRLHENSAAVGFMPEEVCTCGVEVTHDDCVTPIKPDSKLNCLLQPEFPKEDTWISCQAGRAAEFQYACFGNVMQVCIVTSLPCLRPTQSLELSLAVSRLFGGPAIRKQTCCGR